MFQITEQQIENRWNVLPMRLLEVLCSFDTGKMILEICKKNHIIGKKSDKISGLIGFVIMGFLHPEDLAKEIKDALDIHLEIASSIADSVNRKIFIPIRSDIDKVYAPVGVSAEEKLEPVEIPEEHIVDLRTIKDLTDDQRQTTTESSVKPSIGEQPFIIHKEEGAKPILGAKRSLGGLFGFLKGGKESEQKSVEAKIEIGRAEAPALSAGSDLRVPEPPKMKVVHYSEFLSDLRPTTNDRQPTTDDRQPTTDDRQPTTDDRQPTTDDRQPTTDDRQQMTDDKLKEIESPAQIAARVFEKSDQRPTTNDQRPIIDDKNAVPIPSQNPKLEIKESEEVIDLRTLQKISNIKNQNAK